MKRLIVGGVLVSVSTSVFASATVVVQNPSFEAEAELPRGSELFGMFNFDDVPGWETRDVLQAGVFEPSPVGGQLLLPPGFGEQTLFIGGTGSSVSQCLPVSVEAGEVYTLRVQVGDRTNLPLGDGTGGSVGLFTPDGVELASMPFGGDFVLNGWRPIEVAYTGEVEREGEPIVIQLASDGQQVNFDLVEFTGGTAGACSNADLAKPFGVLDLGDVDAFIDAFLEQLPLSDLAAPFGVVDLDDVDVFISAFLAGCP